MISSKLYEYFHQESKVPRKIITRSNFTYSLLTKFIDEILSKYKINNAFDYGCGVGALDLYLASKGIKVKGTDISEKAMSVAKISSEVTNLESYASFISVKKWGLRTERYKYDLILCIEVLEHLVHDQKIVNKFFSELKKGGLLLITVPSKNAPLYKLGLTKSFDKKVGHLRRYFTLDICSIVNDSGFKVIRVVPIEGIIRNSLFIFKPLGNLIRFIRGPITQIVNLLDNITIKPFGESDILILAQKP